jgi:hypothetical protein
MGNHESKGCNGETTINGKAAAKTITDDATKNDQQHIINSNQQQRQDKVVASTALLLSSSSSKDANGHNGGNKSPPMTTTPTTFIPGAKEDVNGVVTNALHGKIASTGSGSNDGFETKSLNELGFEFCFTLYDDQNPNPSSSSLSAPSTPTVHGNDQNADIPQQPSLSWTLDCCIGATRLFRNDTLVTPDTLDTLIPRGNFFDHVSMLCQRVTQTTLVQDLPIDRITIYGNVQALISRDLCSISDGSSSTPMSTSSLNCSSSLRGGDDKMESSILSTNRHRRLRPTLIIMTGKGISRAGLLSVKQLLTSGIEHGSAAYHIHQAIKRGWHVIVLDPNAKGPRSGMEVIAKSLDVLLFFDERPESISNQIGNTIYFLCHSASGGYLVRYLLQQDRPFQRRVKAIAFADSTHRLSWAAEDNYIYDMLQSNRVLYIRNNSLGRDYPFPSHQQPKPGQVAEVDHWWTHRYGNLRTVWAGTSDHSLVCWAARKVIWSFFDGENF